jgi:hypothetical protein
MPWDDSPDYGGPEWSPWKTALLATAVIAIAVLFTYWKQHAG